MGITIKKSHIRGREGAWRLLPFVPVFILPVSLIESISRPRTFPKPELIGTREMVEALLLQSSKLDGYRISFKVEEYTCFGELLSDKELLDAGEKYHWRTLECWTAQNGEQFRMYEHCTWAAEGPIKFAEGHENEFGYDGATYWQHNRDERLNKGALFLSLDESFIPDSYMWQTWIHRRVLNTPREWSFADMLQYPERLEPVLLSDGRTMWDFGVANLQGARLFAMRTDGGPRLVECHSWVEKTRDGKPVPDEHVGDVRVLWDAQVFSKECPISASGRHVGNLNFDPGAGAESQSSLDVITVTEVERIENTESFFSPPEPVKGDVGDSRYRVGYKIGDNKINLDGRIIWTSVPVHGMVGPRLDYWIRTGKLDVGADPETGEAEEEDVKESGEEKPEEEGVPATRPAGEGGA